VRHERRGGGPLPHGLGPLLDQCLVGPGSNAQSGDLPVPRGVLGALAEAER